MPILFFVTGLAAALVQLGVALYALRLGRLTRIRVAGWLLFAAFAFGFWLRLSLAFANLKEGSGSSIVEEMTALAGSTVMLIAFFYIERLYRSQTRVERALAESERRFTSFADNNPAVAWMKQEDGQYVYVNKPFEREFQRSLTTLKGQTDFDVWPPEIAQSLRDHDLEVLRRNKAVELFERVPNASGRAREWWVFKFPFRDEDGNRFVGGMAVDVTRQRQAERELRDSEQRFRAIWDNSIEGMRLTDSNGCILAVNPAYCRLAGLKMEDLIGQLFSSVYASDQSNAILTEYLKGFEQRSLPANVEASVTLRSGKRAVLEAAYSFVDLESQPPLLFGIFRDVTERRRAEEERLTFERKLLDGQKLESLGVLAGGIAHDFNNLLTAVMGNCSLAAMEVTENSPVRPYLQNIENIAVQAADLCRQMLAYSGRGKFVIQHAQLGEVVEEMTHLLQISVNKKVVLKLNLTPGLPSVAVDAAQIRQVIMNLVINASEAIGDKSGVISISTGLMHADKEYLSEMHLPANLEEGDYIYLEVSDTGCGMTPETRARIFDPFFTTKFTGRGLGLAAVLGIVRGHNGCLKVYTEPGRGTTFKLLLPCAAAQTQEARTESPTKDKWTGKGTVLVVDDEETVRTVTAQMLRRFGFEVLTAADGALGVVTFREHAKEITLVLLDMTMPHLSGAEAFREMRRVRADARVILTSGYNEQDATDRFAGKGLNGFLQKPFNASDLREKLKEALATE